MRMLTTPERSRIMRSVKSKNTKPELVVRTLLHRDGFRFRLHYKKLPGKPDIVLTKHRAIILVNGCFWHGHHCHLHNPHKKRSIPWQAKIRRNRERDAKNFEEYRKLGWKVLLVWECAIQGKTSLSLEELLMSLRHWLLYDPQDAEIEGRSSGPTG